MSAAKIKQGELAVTELNPLRRRDRLHADEEQFSTGTAYMPMVPALPAALA